MNDSIRSLLGIYSKYLRSFVLFCFYLMKTPMDVVFLSGWKLQKKVKYLSNGPHTKSRWLVAQTAF